MLKKNFETFGDSFILIWIGVLLVNVKSGTPIAIKGGPKLQNQDDLCLTPGCIKWAAKILEKLDTSVDPCANFYEFACGNFIKESTIPDAGVSADVFTTIQDKLETQVRASLEEQEDDEELGLFKQLKTFYNDCKDTERIEKLGLDSLKAIMTQNGGWPILEGDSWNETLFDWTKLIPKLSRLGFSDDIFFSVSVDVDIKNNSKRTIYITAPDISVSKELFEEDAIVEAYLDFMEDIAVAFGADRIQAKKEVEECFLLESALSNNTLSQEESRNFSKIYNAYTIAQLQSELPSIPWLEYINDVLPDEVQVGSEENLVVTEPEYLRYLEEELKRTPKRVLANYIFVSVVEEAAEALTKELQEILLKLKREVLGIKELPPRWRFCLNYVKLARPELVSALYVRRYFSPNSKDEILHIMKYIKEEFEKILREAEWMDDETRALALKKFKATELHLAYPDELLHDEVLTKTFTNLQIKPGEFFNTILSISRFNSDFNYRRLREQVNKTEWVNHANVAVVNAFFNQVENSLQFPAGILQDQFFDLERPRYMNFGAIGSVIGHEITHGFDDVGRQFDYDGNLGEWWMDGTKETFLKKIECIVEQYGNYSVPNTNKTVNGELTVGENIADNGGTNEAYMAYQTWQTENEPEPLLPGVNYTQNQLFWISLAQTWCEKTTVENLQMQLLGDSHSPNEIRVVGSLSNSEEFSRDFQCPRGTPMNPDSKCKVW